ncbi:MAG: cytochrome c-type biogenesis protein CcmH [Aquabacterium sp.]|nr:cytochrome c-type biogenesis protein CcmH [Aquabacterium sp.]
MRVDVLWRGLARAPGLALAWVLCAVLATALPAHGKEAAPATADPVLEAHVMRLSAELRCLVCQNETIAASHADLAVDLRNQVREMLRSGQTDRQVFDYMTARYGDFVLYRPPLKATTALLWFGPFVFLAGGLLGLWWLLRRRNRLPADQFEPDENDDVPADRPRS